MNIPGKATAKRIVRSLGGKAIRRIGLLPGGVPNRLGDERLAEEFRLGGEIVVFFPDTSGALYQIRQWYGPLHALHEAQGVTIVCMDSRTARAIREEVRIPVLTISQESSLDELVAASDVKLFLYVNFTSYNFLALRYRSVIHVYLTHGDSDKSVTVSNQVKAYDFIFVAGQAAVDRFAEYTPLFNALERCIIVGRPRLDTDELLTVPSRVGEQTVVLYAPTWEGGHESVSYGSVDSHGEALVRSLLDQGLKVIYRPHPLTGQRLASHGEANDRIKALVNSDSRSEVSSGRSLDEDFSASDILITDVSSVAIDWLSYGRPLVVTKSAVRATKEAATRLLSAVPRLTAQEADQVGSLVRSLVNSDDAKEAVVQLSDYYLGDTTPGSSLKRFLQACVTLSELRDKEWERIKKNENSDS